MTLAYTQKLSDSNFFASTILQKLTQKSLTAQTIHLFNNTCVYFDEYPKKFKMHHINKKMKNQFFAIIDKYFFTDNKATEIYVYVVNPICNPSEQTFFYSLSSNIKVPQYLKQVGPINSQIAAVSKIIQTLNSMYTAK